VKSLETAIKLDPANFEPRRELIRLEIKTKKLAYAEKLCREILVINRDDHEERLRLTGILAQEKKYDELIEFLTEESSRYPDDNSSFYRLGLIKEYLKDYQAAIIAFQKSIEIRQTAKAFHALARTYLRISETKKAREALVKATKLDPKKQDSKELLELMDEEYRHAKPGTRKKLSKNKKKSKKVLRKIKK
jgi:tetratricopeptide (TPR) repeat protein